MDVLVMDRGKIQPLVYKKTFLAALVEEISEDWS